MFFFSVIGAIQIQDDDDDDDGKLCQVITVENTLGNNNLRRITRRVSIISHYFVVNFKVT